MLLHDLRMRIGFTVLTLAAAMLIGTIVLTGCSEKEEIITLVMKANDPVELVSLDLNPKGDTGDITTFESALYRDDQPYGSVMGTITKVGSLGQGAKKDREERLAAAVYDLPGGQISVLGISYYFGGATLLPVGESVTRAIVGGTGRFLGADGETTVTRNQDGSYTIVLRILR